jgi:Glycosyl transferase family 2
VTPSPSRPPVSVIVPTRCEWPGVEPVINELRTQIIAVGAELVVVDGTDHGNALDRGTVAIPPELVRVIRAPGLDIYALRAAGLTEATGEIVAMTEDHCVPAPDYVAAILASHERHSEHAVAGAVINGSTSRLIDRVNFLVVHARNLPLPREGPDPSWIPTPSNISYKRTAIPSEVPERGWLETVHNVALLQGNQVALDDRIIVRHVQSTGRLGTFRNHFHAGKSMGGLARTAMGSPAAQLRWGFRSAIRVPAALVRPVWHLRRRSPSDQWAVLTMLPLVVALSAFDAIGFMCGVLAGAGRSPHLMH